MVTYINQGGLQGRGSGSPQYFLRVSRGPQDQDIWEPLIFPMSSAWRTVLRRILRLCWSLAADSMVITGDASHLSTRSIPWLASKKHWVLLAGWSEGHAGLTTAHG